MAGEAVRFTWWWEGIAGGGGGTITPPAPVLRLSDFVTAGRGLVDILALFEAEVSGNDLYNAGNDTGEIADPASDVMLDTTEITLTRVQRDGIDMIFNRSGAGTWSSQLEGTGPFAAGTMYIQTLDGLVTLPVATTLDDAGGGFARFEIPSGASRTIVNGIDTGERFIVALTRPLPLSDRVLWGTDQLLWGSDMLRWAA